MKNILRYQSPALLWAAFIFVVSSIPSSKMPAFFHSINDKMIHAGVFFVFGLLVYRALLTSEKINSFSWIRLIIAVAAVTLYGFSDEYHQRYVPGRTEDILDAAADAAGGILAACCIYLFYMRKRIKNL